MWEAPCLLCLYSIGSLCRKAHILFNPHYPELSRTQLVSLSPPTFALISGTGCW